MTSQARPDQAPEAPAQGNFEGPRKICFARTIALPRQMWVPGPASGVLRAVGGG